MCLYSDLVLYVAFNVILQKCHMTLSCIFLIMLNLSSVWGNIRTLSLICTTFQFISYTSFIKHYFSTWSQACNLHDPCEISKYKGQWAGLVFIPLETTSFVWNQIKSNPTTSLWKCVQPFHVIRFKLSPLLSSSYLYSNPGCFYFISLLFFSIPLSCSSPHPVMRSMWRTYPLLLSSCVLLFCFLLQALWCHIRLHFACSL